MSEALLPLGSDSNPWHTTAFDSVAFGESLNTAELFGEPWLQVPTTALTTLAEEAFFAINHFLRPSHLAQLRTILDDEQASANDRFVAFELLKNANVAAGGILPMCQDTGTAIVHAWRGRTVHTAGGDEAALSAGIKNAYARHNLRYSQLAPLSMYKERNTRTNLPAEIEILAATDDHGDKPAGHEYRLLFVAKGGGSANKSYFFQATPSLLRADALLPFLEEKILQIGTAACPPYHLSVVVGGPSAEYCLRTVKLASTRLLDSLPTTGDESGHGFRDLASEAHLLEASRKNGVGAQFGGRYFCHDLRVIRLPRHGASLPIAIGVSCSADRQALAKINQDGLFLERLERDPARYLPETDKALTQEGEVVEINLNQPMDEICRTLSKHPIRTRLSLSGTLTVARDSAHARIREWLEAGKPLPDYMRNHPIYYAGPAKQPDGYPSGSFGPTTAGRMDSFVEAFQAAGGSRVMLAKGNRSAVVRESCKKHGGFHLGSIGGPAAILAQNNIKSVQVADMEDLGMEAVWRIEVENFPAFVVIDDKGNDFFQELRIA